MGYLESWKELILHPGKEVLKRKKGFDNAKIAAFMAAVALIGSLVVAFGGSGAQLQAMLGLGAPAIFAGHFVYAIAGSLLLFYLIHRMAAALGGKGSFRGLLSVQLEAMLPFSVLTLAYFVPYAGFALGMLAGFASIYAWVVVYKYLRGAYELSLERALAAIIVPGVLVGMIGTALIVGLMVSSFIAGAKAAAPIVTAGAASNHFYSPMYGGYSFDFPVTWEYFDVANDTELGAIASILTQNTFIGMALFSGPESGEGGVVAFQLQKTMGMPLEQQCDTNLIRSYSGKVDTSGAGAEYIKLGRLDGCLLSGIRGRNGTVQTMFATNSCSPSYYTMIDVFGNDTRPLKMIAESFRCGSEAVK